MFTVESKSQLAKLLASENLIVEHKTIPTAYFNLKTRTLSCPIWKDMSGDLYDLLMGHEVAHALYTPEAGWHDAICEEGTKFKGFLNVIEDARIEKKIKRKYPGINKSFLKAYKELLDRDFFGIGDRVINEFHFIDKVNLHTKTGMQFEFSDVEQSMLDRVKACETWEDVVACAKEIFEYSKEEQQTQQTNPDYGDIEMSEMDDDFEDDDSESFEDLSEEDLKDLLEELSGEDSDEDEESDEDELSGSGGASEDSEESEDGDEDESDPFDKSSGDSEFDDDPVCETDENYRQNETTLLDESSREYVYLDIPKAKYENILTPYTIVHKHMTDWFEKRIGLEKMVEVYKDFRSKNDKYISLLAKEFEMRKSARAYLKSKVSDTGDIDINKIFRYKFDDNIFKKVTIQPKGKSHGLVLLLDHSGSMHSNISASIEQVLVLSLFCKKVNIPFVVYSFVDYYEVRKADFPDRSVEDCFEQKRNSLYMEKVFLREYLNSNMSTSEFNRCVRNLTMLADQFNSRWNNVPQSEGFGSTPLIESMVALKNITKKFKKDNNLDIVNTVIVHDGDADRVNQYVNSEDKVRSFSTERHNVYLNDKSEKIQIKLETDKHAYYDYDYALKNAIFEWYKKSTGSKIFGFFIVGRGNAARRNIGYNYRTKKNENLVENYHRGRTYFSEKLTVIMKELKENKFVISYNKGYDSFFLIPGGKDLSVENDELKVTGNVTKGKLKNAFVRMGKKKQTNRVLVTKFITGIA